MTTLEKICLIALAAFWLASAAWPDGESPTSAAAGGSSPIAENDARAGVPPLP